MLQCIRVIKVFCQSVGQSTLLVKIWCSQQLRLTKWRNNLLQKLRQRAEDHFLNNLGRHTNRVHLYMIRGSVFQVLFERAHSQLHVEWPALGVNSNVVCCYFVNGVLGHPSGHRAAIWKPCYILSSISLWSFLVNVQTKGAYWEG